MHHGLRKARQKTIKLLEQNGTNTSDPPTNQSPTAVFTFYVTMHQKKIPFIHDFYSKTDTILIIFIVMLFL